GLLLLGIHFSLPLPSAAGCRLDAMGVSPLHGPNPRKLPALYYNRPRPTTAFTGDVRTPVVAGDRGRGKAATPPHYCAPQDCM
ncbi:unnamed protein product, partial [Urochloa humidicola]